MHGGPAIGKPIIVVESLSISESFGGAFRWTIDGTIRYTDADDPAYAVFDAAADLKPFIKSITQRGTVIAAIDVASDRHGVDKEV